jgi:predicted membrane-bound mannosyltransferase
MTLILFVAFVPPGAVLAAYLGGDDESTVTMLKVMFFVIQALAVVGVMYLLLGWRSGRPIYLLLASACASLFFATKETAFITLGTMLIALISVWIWQRIYGAVNSGPGEDDLSPVRLTWARFRDGMGSGWDNVGLLVACVGLFAYLWVLFFSSFFSYWDGIAASFNAYTIWTKTGSTDHTQNGYLGYVKWLVKLELPIAILSAVGIVVAFLKGRHRFALFTALWAFGLFLAYTIIAYKTPWLALSFILPMCLIAGYAVNEIVKVRNLGKPLGGFLALSDGKPYVYAHTLRGYGDLIKEIDRYSAKSQLGEAATVQVVSPDYWPMPWSLRKYKSAQFFGRFVDSNSAEMIVAKKDEQESGLVEKYAVHYRVAGVYPLRPGVELILLVRRDLAEPGAKDVYRLMDAASQ